MDEVSWGMGSMKLSTNGDGTRGGAAGGGAAPGQAAGPSPVPNVAASLLYRNGGGGDDGSGLTRSSSAPPSLFDALEGEVGHDHKGVESLLENAFDNDGDEKHNAVPGYFDNFAYGRTGTGPPSQRLNPAHRSRTQSYLVATKKAADALESPMSQPPILQPKPSTPTPGAVGDRAVRTISVSEFRDVSKNPAVSPWSKPSVERLNPDTYRTPSPGHTLRAQSQPQNKAPVPRIPGFEVPNDDGGGADAQHGIWGPMPRATSPVIPSAGLPSAKSTQSLRHISAPGSPLNSRSRTATPLQSPMVAQSQSHHGGVHGGVHGMQRGATPQPPQPPQPHAPQSSPVPGSGSQQPFGPAQMSQLAGFSEGDASGLNYSGFLANNYGFGGAGAGGVQSPSSQVPNLQAGGMVPNQFQMGMNAGLGNVGNLFFPGDGASADNLKNMSMQMQMAAFMNAQQLYAAQLAQVAAMNAAASRGGSGGGGSTGLGSNSALPRGSNPWDFGDRELGIIGGGDRRGSPASTPLHGLDHGKKKGGDIGSPNMMNRRMPRGRRGGRQEDYLGYNDRKVNSVGVIGASDSGHARSPLLENFRSTSASVSRPVGSDPGGGVLPIVPMFNTREWQLSEIKGHVVEFATDQHGSRFIQQKLEDASPEEMKAVLTEALQDVQRLMTDVFGNYVVQKLLEHGGPQAVASIAAELKNRMLTLSQHMYGCRVVQKALEVLDSGPRGELVRELDGFILKCIHDQNGNHVIQKCVELVEPQNVQFIVNEVVGQAVTLAKHSYGCRVVQRILEHGSKEQKEPIMEEIMKSVEQLINDQYGNYVIQHVVEHGTQAEREVIIDIARRDIYRLSQHKFASNVVERCLQHGSVEQRHELIEMFIVGEGPPNPSPLSSLVRDQFGNYVVQRILDIAEPSQRERVVEILREQVSAIKKYSYGKHIIARLESGWNRQNSMQRAGNNIFT